MYVVTPLLALLQVIDEAQRALAWLQEKEDLQQRVAKHEDPVLLSSDIRKKEDTLKRVAEPILTKPPPAPKVLFVYHADLSPQIGPCCILALWPFCCQVISHAHMPKACARHRIHIRRQYADMHCCQCTEGGAEAGDASGARGDGNRRAVDQWRAARGGQRALEG